MLFGYSIQLTDVIALFGAFTGAISLFIVYSEYRRKKPDINCTYYNGSYKINQTPKGYDIHVKASFMVTNKGASPTAIMESRAVIRQHPEINQEIYFDGTANGWKLFNEDRPFTWDSLPIGIPASGSTLVVISYTVEVPDQAILDRCGVTINWLNYKKREPLDYPLLIIFYFRHTHGHFKKIACMYREDQPEVQSQYGSYLSQLIHNEFTKTKGNIFK